MLLELVDDERRVAIISEGAIVDASYLAVMNAGLVIGFPIDKELGGEEIKNLSMRQTAIRSSVKICPKLS